MKVRHLALWLVNAGTPFQTTLTESRFGLRVGSSIWTARVGFRCHKGPRRRPGVTRSTSSFEFVPVSHSHFVAVEGIGEVKEVTVPILHKPSCVGFLVLERQPDHE
ncbi:hypothetical protein Clacol_010086 [Clathrus columnatus]|uniref:Secreted protein n=1 Tax=Clathrus columnatus TaxID=1419009 RepID=A0AAV5AT45_9AGAM|nr:hypothetical protein Clacol_010086 [Clathrus columnatus]